MGSIARGTIGLGLTLLILAGGMAVVNGLVRGYAGRKLVNDPDDDNAAALLMLF